MVMRITKPRVLLCAAGLLIGLSGTSAAAADELRDACAMVLKRLNTVTGPQLLRQFNGVFEDEGKVYRGCIATLIGDSSRLPSKAPPGGELLYPSADGPKEMQGWRADREADGPDGTSFRIQKGGVYCTVEGWWDGGDDSDPKVVPSTLYQYSVKCARK